MLFSEQFACVYCGISLGEIAPRTFSFNTPYGACPTCTGIGYRHVIDPDLVINKELTINQGAIIPWATHTWYIWRVRQLARQYDFTLDTPLKDFTPEQLNVLLYGEGGPMHTYKRFGRVVHRSEGFEGIVNQLERAHRDTQSEGSRENYERYMVYQPCEECQGKRLKPEALSVLIGGKNIMDVASIPVLKSFDWVNQIEKNVLTEREKMIAQKYLKK